MFFNNVAISLSPQLPTKQTCPKIDCGRFIWRKHLSGQSKCFEGSVGSLPLLFVPSTQVCKVFDDNSLSLAFKLATKQA